MALTRLGVFLDPNIHGKVTGEAWDNTDYIYDNHNISDNHIRDRDGVYREGGPWLMTKVHVVKEPSAVTEAWWDPHPIYRGCFVAPTPPPPPQLTLDLLEGYGPELWNRMKPDKPVMSLGNALYELKDVPSMLRDRFEINNLKDIANYNLAVNFGWVPLLTDIRNFVNAHKNLIGALAQLLRNNGRPVRRRIPVENYLSQDSNDTISDTTELPPGFSYPTLVSYAYMGSVRKEVKTSFQRRIWAAGSFRYWVPEMGSMTKDQYRRKMYRRLMGLRPSPFYVYRALPWSWMIDWFTNLGDNISNMNAQVADRLICDYAYIMRSVESKAICTVSVPIHLGSGSSRLMTATTSVSRVWKERVSATPFGFRVKSEDLSPFQLSILSSIGGQKLMR